MSDTPTLHAWNVATQLPVTDAEATVMILWCIGQTEVVRYIRRLATKDDRSPSETVALRAAWARRGDPETPR